MFVIPVMFAFPVPASFEMTAVPIVIAVIGMPVTVIRIAVNRIDIRPVIAISGIRIFAVGGSAITITAFDFASTCKDQRRQAYQTKNPLHKQILLLSISNRPAHPTIGS